jgi:ribosome-associated protein
LRPRPRATIYADPTAPQELKLTNSVDTPPADLSVPPEGDAVESLEALILARLDDDKAEDVVLIDLKGKSPLADAVVVASGRSARHVAAMADHLLRTLKENGFGKAQVEGLPHADWVLIDAGDVIVHLFRPEVRAFYQIEKIWSVDSPHMKPRSTAFGG